MGIKWQPFEGQYYIISTSIPLGKLGFKSQAKK